MRRSDVKDWLAIIAGLLFLALIPVAIGFSIWVHFLAPCHQIEWLPIKEIPTRCLTVSR